MKKKVFIIAASLAVAIIATVIVGLICAETVYEVEIVGVYLDETSPVPPVATCDFEPSDYTNETIKPSFSGLYDFDLDFYAEEIAQFPSDKVLGPVTSTKDAKEKAETVWLEIYGEDVKKEKPYGVCYDIDTGTWLVLGHLPMGAIGGVAHILIRESDGAVLAVWHDK